MRLSGMKTRVVFGYAYQIQSIEMIFLELFVSRLKCGISPLVYSPYQMDISKIVTKSKTSHTYSFDYKKFDNSVPSDLLCLSFGYIERVIRLDGYLLTLFRFVRNYFLCVPSFHPLTGLIERKRGVASGSSFTNLVDSIANYCSAHICIFAYFRSLGVNAVDVKYEVVCSGDDWFLSIDRKLDIDKLSCIIKSKFNLTLELTDYSPPGVDRTHFLGSSWVDGKPTRPFNSLVSSLLFGSGNFPKMDTNTLFCSRFIDVFCNSSDAALNFKLFGLRLPNRLFQFSESTRFSSLVALRSLTKKDVPITRGIWYDNPYKTINELSNVWETR